MAIGPSSVMDQDHLQVAASLPAGPLQAAWPSPCIYILYIYTPPVFGIESLKFLIDLDPLDFEKFPNCLALDCLRVFVGASGAKLDLFGLACR